MTARVASGQVDFYREHGYQIFEDQVFNKEKFDDLVRIFEEHLADKGDKLSDELDTPHWRDPRLLDFLLADEVLDIVEPIIGPDIVLWSSHFISKDPHVGRATPWHEDSAYWKGRLDDYSRIVTVWLSLDGSDTENGCMRVIPGTHNNGFSNYVPIDRTTNTFGSRIDEVDESQAVDFVLKPGQASLHDARIVHGAEPNHSDRRRTGYTMRYLSSRARIISEAYPGFKVWLARGVDHASNSYQNA